MISLSSMIDEHRAPSVCPRCGAITASDHQTCTACGHSLASPGPDASDLDDVPRLASLPRRAAATLLDLFLIALLQTVPLVFAEPAEPSEDPGFFNLLLSPLPILYFLNDGVLQSLSGRSIGKAILGIRVVRTDGRDVGFVSGMIRLLGTLTIVSPILALVRPDRRALHDLMAGAVVIRTVKGATRAIEPASSVESPAPPASLRHRAAARLLDALVLLFVLIVLSYAVPAEGGETLTWPEYLRRYPFWIIYLINDGLVGSLTGATFGKWLLGTRMVKVDGTPLGIPRGILRFLASNLSWALLLVGYLVGVFRADRRTLHDLAAGSTVVSVVSRAPSRQSA